MNIELQEDFKKHEELELNKEDIFEKFKEHYLNRDLSYILGRYIQRDLYSEITVKMNPDYSGCGIRDMIKDIILADIEYAFERFCSFDSSDFADEIYDFANDLIQENFEIEVRFNTPKTRLKHT
ncbi:hypothetical protein AP064_05105 [Candidatus Liberibacter solanacearum]|uniref:Uncharacterized protein n=1 Tax=Candidatus Liberibacter solanacearum TaxID=556287 RepID=A0A0F4VM90_9HYPH|nr:hypothetical protein [Candidatus Liberibacter solanacearum]KJZ82514.1 hypothetical protein DJ66_0121 [Candidatus Liberibacter solanacearum]KQC48738.1 hypothetical protein AP064_05105 [Candidatus Liberibacter solanacearum]